MTKNNLVYSLAFLVGVFCFQTANAQPESTPTPKLSTELAKNLGQTNEVSRERREQAYAKLLEAQRYLWSMSRVRTPAGVTAGTKLAKQALQKAVELDPTLAEAYTALAEITLTTPPNDIDEAIMLATIAIKINPDNYGSHRILARVYTIKSKLNVGTLDPGFTQKAIAEWKEIARLDPKNAEGWAFLSDFYNRTGKDEERIEALKKWMASASPLETRFYRTILGNQEDLSPVSAGLKLGAALLKVGRTGEAIDILSRSVADEPDNEEAIDLLRQAIESNEGDSSNKTLELLQQAVFANPSSLALIDLLAEVQSKLGKTDDAVKTIRNTIKNFSQGDKNTVAKLHVSLGDIYSQANRNNEAITAYEDALKAFGIEKSQLTTDDEREFATKVFEKMIKTYKNAGRINDAKATIERARVLLGKNDLFSDKQIISLLRETRQNQEALVAVRTARQRAREDYSLIRLEATILTDLGKVDEGVAIIKTLIDNKPAIPTPFYDDFSNYLFISGLYSQAKRVKESISAAQQAFNVAESEDRKQLANLSIATAQHQSGDFKSAEATLKTILKKTPTNPIALNNLGYFLIDRNERISEAVELIKQAVKIDPTNSSYLDSLGWGFFKLGNFVESEKYLKAAIRYNQSSPTIYEHLGDVYQKQGKETLAKNAWQKALNYSSDSNIATRIKAKMSNRQN